MKKLIILAIFSVFSFGINAQCDIAQKLVSVSPASISVGADASFKFSIGNEGTGSTCAYPVGSVEVVLSLPTTGYNFKSISAPSGGNGTYFNWVYDAVEKVVIGTNHTAIPIGGIESDVTVLVTGIAASKNQSNLNIGILDGSNNASVANDPAVLKLEVINSNPLPVRLVSFDGKSIAEGNLLSWKTSSEVNFSHYEVEKSLNSKEFKFVEKVNGATNTKETLQYTYLDEFSKAGMLPGANLNSNSNDYYYRLKMVDLDGSTSFSKIIFIENENNKAVVGEFYPNPTIDNHVSVEVLAPEAGEWQIIRYDVSGKVISNVTKILSKGKNIINLTLEGNSNGTNLVRLDNNKNIHLRKIIKN